MNFTDFFTDLRAREAFQARLRYLVARFGHHSSIFAWELFNEVNCDNSIPGHQALADWHLAMAQTLDSGPDDHMVTVRTEAIDSRFGGFTNVISGVFSERSDHGCAFVDLLLRGGDQRFIGAILD